MKNNIPDDDFLFIATDMKGSVLPNDLRAKMKTAIDQRKQAIIENELISTKDAELNWIEVNSDIRFKVLHRDRVAGHQINLWQLDPGASIPAHSHSVTEECFIVSGTLQIGDQLLQAGDLHVAPSGSEHEFGLSTETGCTLYIRQATNNDYRRWL